MKKSKGCNFSEVKINNKWYKRITNLYYDICPDCNTKYGELHHFGCEQEEDPSNIEIQLINNKVKGLRNKRKNKKIIFQY